MDGTLYPIGETLAGTAWESGCAAILTDASTAAVASPAAAAVTLRAALPDLTALTPAERALLADWLDRIAESRARDRRSYEQELLRARQ